ncbi:hypothetical protein EMIHUDRAFT_368782 [Emiliania huxleyi CCMP1516]|uniref:Calcineurin-like phosphoesterase domain-containing protein n=2 Tax=Emiliania huxleyi TaxID=2903 RepID=A0A0D3JCZ2_EMIH1|nr:hypothetical protein EMIHUDRAFT_368782 [Emiliania huxleyi CCMP1516]EOD21377.1 hypothetical protein EMIHUDRAFT_368782 [Emiliania huxleyi CCMP1516]|eukprot:XP_005773806.1 hypothetical protein EMIHUDRAFT_368782 [Emiliania huxleyi CCMP1516]
MECDQSIDSSDAICECAALAPPSPPPRRPVPPSQPSPPASPPLPPAVVRFAVIGDFGVSNQMERDVAALVASWDVDFVISAGDNRYDSHTLNETVGGIALYGAFLPDAPAGRENRFFPCVGNHDVSDGGGIAEYRRFFSLPGEGVATSGTSGSELFYDFYQADGALHVFVLDSEAVDATIPQQQTWLQEQLSRSSAAWKIVVMHHSPFSSSSKHGSKSFMQWPFAEWGASIVISGHDHHYERIEHGGIVYFVNGAGGRTLYSVSDQLVDGSKATFDSDHGAQVIAIGGGYVHSAFVSRTGEVVDEAAYSLASLTWTAPPPATPSPPSPPSPPSVPPGECDEASWPDKDGGLVCGKCKVLVDNFDSYYGSCDGYCAAIGRSCTGAWEESGDTCTVKHDMACDQSIASSDAICECAALAPLSPG